MTALRLNCAHSGTRSSSIEASGTSVTKCSGSSEGFDCAESADEDWASDIHPSTKWGSLKTEKESFSELYVSTRKNTNGLSGFQAIQALCNDLMNGINVLHANQLLIQRAIKIGKTVRVKPHLMQSRRMKILHMQRILHRG